LGKRVLIADDEKNMRWVLGEALTAEGYEIIEAADGKEALAAVKDMPPDLMVLDHKMPRPDGMEVLRRLRADGHIFPIIMLTAHGNVATAVEAMKAGATEYVTKPFDLDELKLATRRPSASGSCRRRSTGSAPSSIATGTSTASSPPINA
jgi:two-component system response regulator AtoC